MKATGNGLYVDFGATCTDALGNTINESVMIKIRPS